MNVKLKSTYAGQTASYRCGPERPGIQVIRLVQDSRYFQEDLEIPEHQLLQLDLAILHPRILVVLRYAQHEKYTCY